MKTIGELVEDLFITHRKSDGREYSNKEVAQAIGCDQSYLAKLRRGVITNPGRDNLIELARFFDVPIIYFFPELEGYSIDQNTSQEEQIDIALRSIGLENEESSHIKAIINLILGRKK